MSGSTDRLLSGNEAMARGALEAGIGFCASYPGTPSTEIAQTLMRTAQESNHLYVEWSTNERVALEASVAASWAGMPALCPMKSLGLNVAADFLMNVNLSGTGSGGLVIVVCDDPRGHSSSNEQDSRFYAKAAMVPLLEPSSYQDAKDIIPVAFEISKEHDIPVIVRSTTRLSHSRGVVREGQIPKPNWSIDTPIRGRFNVPNPHLRHQDLLEKLTQIERKFEASVFNKQQTQKNSDLLLFSTGISSRYAEEAILGLASQRVDRLTLSTTYPTPRKYVAKALESYERILFVEENDPFVEDEVRIIASMQDRKEASLYGKRTGHMPTIGELNTDIVRDRLASLMGISLKEPSTPEREEASRLLVSRPLTFCPGCTHRNFYYALNRVRKRLGGKLVVAGDIGCYSLGVFYDEAMNTMQSMGAGIGIASGLGKLDRFGLEDKVFAVAGDSTFFHAALPGLVNARHKNADLTFVILDNQTTAMTGFQVHPGSRKQSTELTTISIEEIVKSLKPDEFRRGDAADVASLTDLLHKTSLKQGLKVILLDSICRLEAREDETKGLPVRIDEATCKGESCKICIRDFGCPAIGWDEHTKHPVILDDICVRCGACLVVCPHDAIKEVDG